MVSSWIKHLLLILAQLGRAMQQGKKGSTKCSYYIFHNNNAKSHKKEVLL